jgi:hypothetical protein
MGGKEDTISTLQIRDMYDSMDPEDYSIFILQIALRGLKIDHLPNPHARGYDSLRKERAHACLFLLSSVGPPSRVNPEIEAPAIDLITSQSEGICRCAHRHVVTSKEL